jgi:hypothetical protein
MIAKHAASLISCTEDHSPSDAGVILLSMESNLIVQQESAQIEW